MLQQQAVVEGDMGPVLAEFLVEFLPFEEEARDQIRSVRLVLQGKLISMPERARLWERGRNRNAFHVGFLQAVPDDLPDKPPPHPARGGIQRPLAGLLASGNPFARQYARLLGPAGQAFLATVQRVMHKPSNQDVMVELMHALAAYSSMLPLQGAGWPDIALMDATADALMCGEQARDKAAAEALAALVGALPQEGQRIHAMLVLAMLDEPVLNPVFSRTDAIGTVMRKKLRPVTDPVLEQIGLLLKD
jgi:hypothetical protein